MKKYIAIIALSLVVIAAFGVLVRGFDPKKLLPEMSEEQIKQSVLTAIQREAPAQFYVTGTLDLSTTAISKSEKRLLPGLLDLDMGTTVANINVPGRASYGFDVSLLKMEDINLKGDSVLEIKVPSLAVHLVEPDLPRMQIMTKAGWARLESSSGKRMERRSLDAVVPAMREQAASYIVNNLQPVINTELALEKLVSPVLSAAGLKRMDVRLVRSGDQALLSK
ncbi:MAG TPA: DUF4230 domain-containing protein [Candidatus Kapabacteria bacterium]|nr:DUF4230 domain-containing protein [Candidatus Kapabacteria bacterium]